MTGESGGVIYGVRLRSAAEYRYIGLTAKTPEVRLAKHFQVARSGRKTPFYDWLRKQKREDVVVDVLNDIGDRTELGQAEIDWIAYLKAEGEPLLNIADGGLGPTGVEWTEEMREQARIRSTGRKGLSRYGHENPFFGHHHSEEQRVAWSSARKGTNTGVENPNFGKYGADHPAFGRTVSAETRALLSSQKIGARNPNFGRRASDETRAKMSAAQKGVPKPSSRRSAHTRHHTNKNVYKAECSYCREDGPGEVPERRL